MTKNIDKLFDAEQEVRNHSRYIANTTINIKKYISEKTSGIANAIAGATGGETHLVIAPTGSGKTYSIINLLKEVNIKSIFVLPNSANVEQAMIEYDIPGAYDNRDAISELSKGNVVVMTWDKITQLKDTDLSEHIIVIDEIHQTFTDDYRKKAINGLYDTLKAFKGRLDITATPNKLDFVIYQNITEYKQEKQTQYNVKLYNNTDTKTMIDIINNSNNSALLMNNIKDLKFISKNIYKSSDIVSSDLKEHSKIYDCIMINSDMGKYETLLNTTTIVAGVNINNPNITDVIVVGIKDIGTIKQYVARFRGLEKCNVHIFNTYENECKIYDIEWLVNENINKADILKEAYNIACNENTEFSTLGLNINPINLDTNIYFDKDTNAYEVDKTYIRTKIYKKYYNKRTIESFKWLLGEYFSNVEIVYNIEINTEVLSKKIEHNKDLKEAKEEAISILEKHKDILVGYDEVRKDKKSFSLMEYQNLNGLSMDHMQKEYLKHGIHDLILDNNLKSMINLYSKYVLENSFSLDIAWKLANMHNRTRGNIFRKINTLVYRELKEEYPNVFINQNNIETRMYEWLINELKIGTSYTNEHLEMLSEAFRVRFGDNWGITTKKLGEILNQTYNIECYQTQKCNPIETLFYRNINPIALQEGKRIKINLIKSKIELSDIKKELAVTSSDLSLEFSIQKRKTKILNQLDKTEKEILLEGVF